MIICPKCRAKLGDGSSVCVVCGTSLTGGTPEPAKAPEPAQAAVAPAVAAVAPATAPPPATAPIQQVPINIEARPLEARPLPRSELIDEKKPEAPPAQPALPEQPVAQAQPPQPAAQGQQALPPQQPPPPDHPMYQQQQQQYAQQAPQGTMNTHPYVQGQPNQCPRCHHPNMVYYYNDGTAYCGTCQYRFYWRAPTDSIDSFGRDLGNLFG